LSPLAEFSSRIEKSLLRAFKESEGVLRQLFYMNVGIYI